MQSPFSHDDRQLIVVGDRVLIHIEQGDEVTANGLILPQTVADKQQVMSGRVAAVGPGVPMPAHDEKLDEPWREPERRTNFIPMQAQVGDHALFLRKASFEIQFRGENYLIVPQAGILVLLRDEGGEKHEGPPPQHPDFQS